MAPGFQGGDGQGTLQRRGSNMTGVDGTVGGFTAPAKVPNRAGSVGSSGSSASSQLSRALSALKDTAEPEVWRIRNLLLMLIVMAVCFATIAVVWIGLRIEKLERAKSAIWLVGHRTGAFQLARGDIARAVAASERRVLTSLYQNEREDL